MLFYWLTIFSLFIVDRLTKVYILQKSSLVSNLVESVQDDFFVLYLNKNLAFSLPVSIFILWPLLILILSFLLFFCYQAYQAKQLTVWPLSLIVVGAISNILDRLLYGGAVDFISFWNFPIFNLSDVYISFGVAWFLYLELKKPKL